MLESLKRKSVIRSLHRALLFAHEHPEHREALFSDEMRFLASVVLAGGRTEAQIFQDLWVLFETGGKTNGYFVEFGATDGKTISNTYLLERDHGWNGILAEPAPVWHDVLRKNRKCHITDKCVWKTSGETLQFDMVENTGYSTVASFSSADLHSEARRADKRQIEVSTISLNDLLDAYDAPAVVDFMSIDTEGSELEVLKAFDFSRRTVGLICVEHNWTASEKVLDDLLVENGFERRFPEFSMFDGWYRNTRLRSVSRKAAE